MLVLLYNSPFVLYAIAKMDDIFSSHGNFLKSCSFRNDSHLAISIIRKVMYLRNV